MFWGAAALVLIQICRKAAGRNELCIKKSSFSETTDRNFLSCLISEDKGLHINIKIILFGLFIRLLILLLAYVFLRLEGLDASIADVFISFNRWDAPHYLNLAQTGYSLTENGSHIFVVFFPLYPFAIRLVNVIVGNYLISAYIVSFAAYIAGLCYLYHLVRIDFSKTVAWWAVLLISIFPHAIFFGAPHTESLFLLTTAMTLYYIRTHKWLIAGVAGAFAASTRMVGIVLVVVAAVEFATTYKIFTLMKKERLKELFALVCKKGLLILLMFAGTGIYLFINWHITGDPFRFLYYQNYNWNNGFLYFGAAMRMQFDNILPHIGNISQNSMLYVAVPNILGFGFSIWMIVYAALNRHNTSYIVYSLGYVFISFSMAWLLSGGRYAAALIPSFIFLADYVDKKPHRRIIVPVIFIILLLPILRMYILEGFVM